MIAYVDLSPLSPATAFKPPVLRERTHCSIFLAFPPLCRIFVLCSGDQEALQPLTVKQVIVIIKEHGVSMGPGVPIGTKGNHLSLMPERRELTPSGREELVSFVPNITSFC